MLSEALKRSLAKNTNIMLARGYSVDYLARRARTMLTAELPVEFRRRGREDLAQEVENNVDEGLQIIGGVLGLM